MLNDQSSPEKILSIVMKAIKEVNEEMGYDILKNPTPETLIYDGENGIDSLSLVFLISTIEAEINREFDSNVLIASEKAMSMRNSPFRTVESLAHFIDLELGAS